MWQELKIAVTQDRTGDLQIFSLTLSQLSYRGYGSHAEFRGRQRGNMLRSFTMLPRWKLPPHVSSTSAHLPNQEGIFATPQM